MNSIQSVSFPDMVIAVQSQANPELFELECDSSNVFIDFRDSTRSVLSSLLTTVWGIVPTYEKWSLVHNKLITNHIWALGGTPFGSLSQSIQLSFSQTDAAVKHILFSEIHSVLSEVNSLFSHYTVRIIFISEKKKSKIEFLFIFIRSMDFK